MIERLRGHAAAPAEHEAAGTGKEQHQQPADTERQVAPKIVISARPHGVKAVEPGGVRAQGGAAGAGTGGIDGGQLEMGIVAGVLELGDQRGASLA